MKLFFVKSIVFICLLLLSINYISTLFVEPKHYMNTVHDFNKIADENKEIDICIYGSSHVYSSFDPAIIDSVTRARSFNFGSAAQRVAVTKYVMGESFKRTTPKVVVIDLYASSIKTAINEENLSFQKQAYNFFGFSLDKLRSAIEVFPIGQVPEVVFPVFDRKDYRLDFDNLTFNGDSRYKTHELMWEYKGFAGLPLIMKNNKEYDRSLFINFKSENLKTEATVTYTKQERQNIYSLIKKAKSKGAEVLIVTAPFLPAMIDETYYAFHKYINTICKENGVQYLDFNFLGNEIGLDLKDFRNPSHLNQFGARKVSLYLAKYINEQYELPNREKEKAWLQEQPINTLGYLSEFYEHESLKINKQLTEGITIVSFGSYNEGDKKTFIFKVNDSIVETALQKYKIALYLYPKEGDKELLTGKDAHYESSNFVPSLLQIKGNKYIVKKISTPITEFAKIRFFLFDKSGYKGVVGKAVEIENITARQKIRE